MLTVQARADMACHRDPALGKMYALVRSEALLEDRLNRLKHQVSDASLAQMPDFNQRVQVLRQLDYISAEDVVELKVRLDSPLWFTSSAICVAQSYERLDMLRSLDYACKLQACTPHVCCVSVPTHTAFGSRQGLSIIQVSLGRAAVSMALQWYASRELSCL